MLEILDTTLREGEPTPYVNFTVDEKVEIARMLDRVAIFYATSKIHLDAKLHKTEKKRWRSFKSMYVTQRVWD